MSKNSFGQELLSAFNKVIAEQNCSNVIPLVFASRSLPSKKVEQSDSLEMIPMLRSSGSAR
jgi:hypothetical protein